ncbi:MAG: hypothetical protein GY809_15345 [Planctomycetes bacterium]|nr:hypothetical protein [Planctomycetota bacterium]
MKHNIEAINYAVSIIFKAAIVAAKYSGRVRKRSLKRLAAMGIDEKDKEILFLRDKVNQLETQVAILQKRIRKHQTKPRYTLRERFFILWHMETFQIPRRKVTKHLGVSRSTLYRWLHRIQDDSEQTRIPANKTLNDIAALIWEMTKANIDWGRFRISNQLALLNIFISASTVRNILQRPVPETGPARIAKKDNQEHDEPRKIPAWYPNHVWSIDMTEVRCWGLWPIHICIAIDHLLGDVRMFTGCIILFTRVSDNRVAFVFSRKWPGLAAAANPV